MLLIVFITAGILSGMHVYTYGRWLKQQGNISGSVLAFLIAAMVTILPILRFITK